MLKRSFYCYQIEEFEDQKSLKVKGTYVIEVCWLSGLKGCVPLWNTLKTECFFQK